MVKAKAIVSMVNFKLFPWVGVENESNANLSFQLSCS